MQQNANFVTMMVFPFGLMSLSILGLGLGVWVVRRR
jgi:F0F1-type ATP synthase assembly protein I